MAQCRCCRFLAPWFALLPCHSYKHGIWGSGERYEDIYKVNVLALFDVSLKVETQSM